MHDKQLKYISSNSEALYGYNIKNETNVGINKIRPNSLNRIFYQTINYFILQLITNLF